MKKWYSIGLLVVVVIMASAFLVACGDEEETTTTEAMTETTEAMTEETVPEDATEVAEDVELGLYFEDLGNNVVMVTDVPAPGLSFPIHTTPDDDFAMVIEVLDADGNVLGTLETDTGEVDYSEYAADAAKIVVTNKAGDSWEYEIGM